jgi:hypothetical protein
MPWDFCLSDSWEALLQEFIKKMKLPATKSTLVPTSVGNVGG